MDREQRKVVGRALLCRAIAIAVRYGRRVMCFSYEKLVLISSYRLARLLDCIDSYCFVLLVCRAEIRTMLIMDMVSFCLKILCLPVV